MMIMKKIGWKVGEMKDRCTCLILYAWSKSSNELGLGIVIDGRWDEMHVDAHVDPDVSSERLGIPWVRFGSEFSVKSSA